MERHHNSSETPAQAGGVWGRVVSMAAAGLVFTAGLVFALGGGSGQAAATPGLAFHGEEITLVMPPGEGDGYVRIHLLLADDGSGSFDDVVAQARANALAGFPGAVEVDETHVSAAFLTFTSWDPPSANWAYNSSGEPAGLSGVGGVIASAANAWNGAGGSPWSYSGGGSTSASPANVCSTSNDDGQSVVGWTDSLGGSTLASTCTWFGPTATEFDMVFSRAWEWTIGAPVHTDLYSVAMHEFGHALGLLHTEAGNCPGAAMCGSYNTGTVFDGPQADDIAGIVSLYGGGVPPTAEPTSTSTSTPAAPPPPPSKHAFFLPGVARD